MKVVAYLRVSTDRQAEEGHGLDVQEEAIRAWAKKQGHRIVTWTGDEGVSGSNSLDNRIGLADAVSAIRTGVATGLVVYRLDRLARDLIVQETLLAEIKRGGGEVLSTSAAEAGYLTDDPDDPSRKLIRQVLGAVSEYERSMIALRLRSGRRRKHEQGGFAYGSPRFGFKAEHGALVPDDEQQVTVRRIAALRSEGASLRAIAEALAAEGFTPKRGGRWHTETIRRICRRLDNHPAASAA
jgi:DNA invertase Pin-like site-specific DNA recombinase